MEKIRLSAMILLFIWYIISISIIHWISKLLEKLEGYYVKLRKAYRGLPW